MNRIRLRERTFKRVAFFSTFGGILVMAIGLQRLVSAGQAWQALVLFVAGALIALISVVLELVPEPRFVVTLYGRQQCSLCDEARAFLLGLRDAYGYDVWEVDVDAVGEAEALANYGDFVPVAVLSADAVAKGEDAELFRFQADVVRTESRLRAVAERKARR